MLGVLQQRNFQNIYDCDRHMKRLFHEDWKYFNELQAAFKNYSNGPLNRIERMEETIRKYSPNTAEIVQTNVFEVCNHYFSSLA